MTAIIFLQDNARIHAAMVTGIDSYGKLTTLTWFEPIEHVNGVLIMLSLKVFRRSSSLWMLKYLGSKYIYLRVAGVCSRPFDMCADVRPTPCHYYYT